MCHSAYLRFAFSLWLGVILAACAPSEVTVKPASPAASPSDTPQAVPSATPSAIQPPASITPIPTNTPYSIPGIDSPITVQGVTFQIVSAALQGSYDVYGQTHEPTDPNDSLLVVMADLLEGEQQGIFDWTVSCRDEQGRQDVASITTIGTTDSGQPQITWVFAVSKTSRSLVLELPESVTIDLAPLLGGGP